MQKVCRNCGQRVSEKAQFCYKCGSAELEENSTGKTLLMLLGILAGIIIVMWLAAQANSNWY